MRRLAFLIANLAFAQTFVAQKSGTEASLRGISVVDSRVAWASGSGGVYLRTVDGGSHWLLARLPSGKDLDFRAVVAFSADIAYLLSIGEGDQSRVYETVDGGGHWTLQFRNPDPHGFFDALKFSDRLHGAILGDPVNGAFALFTTADAGKNWQRQSLPPAHPAEGAFAASNSSLFLQSGGGIWFATGGVGGGRIFHSPNRALTWTTVVTPLRGDAPGAGVFSLFLNGENVLAVGGDYTRPELSDRNLALSHDGGITWSAPTRRKPLGYRSSVLYVPSHRVWIATGPGGSDASHDAGRSWTGLSTKGFHALGIGAGGAVWAVGSEGRIARIEFSRQSPARPKTHELKPSPRP